MKDPAPSCEDPATSATAAAGPRAFNPRPDTRILIDGLRPLDGPNVALSATDLLWARILIVDDQPSLVALLEGILHEAGYVSVASTTDPTEVLPLHRRNRYDLILLDLQMPGLSGFQVLEQLKEIETDGTLPVLVISANPEHKLQALQAGARDFVTKPFDHAEVLVRVHNLLTVRLLQRVDAGLNLKRLENAQRIAGLGDWDHDYHTQRLHWSEEVYRIIGVARTDTPPTSEIFYRCVHPDDLAFVHREKQAAAEGRRRVEFEHRIIRPDGTERLIHQIAEMHYDEQGRPARESGTIQDVTERTLASAALRLSEERYRLLFESNPSPMWAFDPATLEFLAVNDTAIQHYGYSREEFLRLDASAIRPPEMVQDFLQRLSGTPESLRAAGRFLHRKKDGTVFPVDIFSQLIDFAGRPARLVLALDMTEQERTAGALRASEARYRALSETAPLGIFECDTAGRVIYYNPALSTLTGRGAGDSHGHSWEESIHPDDRAAVSADWAAAVATGNAWERELRLLRPDGSECWVRTHAAPSRDAAGRITGFVGTVEDITARRRSDESLRLLGSAVQQAKESIIITDAELDLPGPRIIFVNPAFTEQTGYSAEEVIGRTPRILQGPRTDRALLDRLRRNLTEGEAFEGEGINYRKDGTAYDLEWQITPIRDAGGKITHYLALQRDISVRKQAEEHLREKTAFLEAKVDASLDGILIVDPQGKIILQNRLLRGLLRVPDTMRVDDADATLLQHAAGLMRNRDAFLAKVNQLYAQPDETSQEELELKDGSVLDRFSSPVRGKDGRIYGRIWTFRDITARKQADTRLRASEVRYRRLFEAAQDGVLILNFVTGMIEDVNPFMLDLLGYTKAELLGKKVWDLGRFHNLVANQEKFEELQRTEYVSYDDLPLETADGRQIAVEFVSNVYEEGATKVIQCNIRDITSRKTAERALRDSEKRFKFVARAVSDVIWDWDLAANTLWWNDGFLTTFGFAAGEVEPKVDFWISRIHPEERSRVVDSMQQAIAGRDEVWSAEYRFQRKDGSYACVEDRGYLLRDATGRGSRMVGGMRDLTEQKKMEAQYLRAQRMESIGTLAGGIAHDLNNVLAPILMSIELLKRSMGGDPKVATLLDTINVSCRRGADMVRQVLSFARGVEGERVPIRLRHLIDELQGIITSTFPRNIRIVSAVPDDLWPLMGDPSQLHQVLLNLAVNARDAMLRGGTLTFTASNLTLDAQYAGMIPGAHPGMYVVLQVTDTGAGIPPEIRERIFEPFFTTKELDKGTGLGLATVHTVVKSHGGFVAVESEVGHGTTFKIYLPAEPVLRSVDTAPPFPSQLPRGHGELVLVVDDEPSIREITQRTLEAFNYRVIAASDGAEAVAIYARQPRDFALVLTDMMMPIMDGMATIKVLRHINPSVRIIAASGLASGDDFAKLQGTDMPHFLPKPFAAQTLLHLVREVIDASASLSPGQSG